VYRSPKPPLRGTMANQVKRFSSKEEYLNPFTTERGVPVSDIVATFEEASEIRDRLKEKDPNHFYGVCYTTSVAIIDVKTEQVR